MQRSCSGSPVGVGEGGVGDGDHLPILWSSGLGMCTYSLNKLPIHMHVCTSSGRARVRACVCM